MHKRSFENTNKSQQFENDEFNHVKNSAKRKQKERVVRKKRKKLNALKRFLRFLFVILLIGGMYFLLTLKDWYLPADTFKNINGNRIEVINNSIIPTYYIKGSLKNISVSKLPIFMVSVKPIQKELYKIPMLKTIYIRRYAFPARIQIIVKERHPVALIKTDLKAKPQVIFTDDGKLIPNSKYMNINDSYDILKILTNPQDIKKEINVEKINEINKIVKAVETFSNEKVEYIDLRKNNDVYVKIKTANIRLGSLDSTVYERIERIYTILPQITDMNSQIRYIDLSWDKVNYLKMKK